MKTAAAAKQVKNEMKLLGNIACFIILAAVINTFYYYFTDDLFSGKNERVSSEPIINRNTGEIYILDKTKHIVYDRNLNILKKKIKTTKYFLNKINFEFWHNLKINNQTKKNYRPKKKFLSHGSSFHYLNDGLEYLYMLYDEGLFEIYSKNSKKYPYKYFGKNGVKDTLLEIQKFTGFRPIYSQYGSRSKCNIFFTDKDGLYNFDNETKKSAALLNFQSPNNSSQYFYKQTQSGIEESYIFSQSEKILSVFNLESKKICSINLNFIPENVTEFKAILADSGNIIFLYTDSDSDYNYHNFLYYNITGRLLKKDFLKLEITDLMKKKRYDLFDMINYSQIGMFPVLLFFGDGEKNIKTGLHHNIIAGGFEYKIKYYGIALLVGFFLFFIYSIISKLYKIKINKITTVICFILFPITGILIVFFQLKKLEEN